MTMYYISRIFQIIAKHKKEVILILLLSVICLFLTGKMYDMQHVLHATCFSGKYKKVSRAIHG